MMDLPTRSGNKADHLLCVGSWLLDKKSRRFWIGGEELRLSLLEFELLAFLMAYPNHAFLLMSSFALFGDMIRIRVEARNR